MRIRRRRRFGGSVLHKLQANQILSKRSITSTDRLVAATPTSADTALSASGWGEALSAEDLAPEAAAFESVDAGALESVVEAAGVAEEVVAAVAGTSLAGYNQEQLSDPTMHAQHRVDCKRRRLATDAGCAEAGLFASGLGAALSADALAAAVFESSAFESVAEAAEAAAAAAAEAGAGAGAGAGAVVVAAVDAAFAAPSNCLFASAFFSSSVLGLKPNSLTLQKREKMREKAGSRSGQKCSVRGEGARRGGGWYRV